MQKNEKIEYEFVNKEVWRNNNYKFIGQLKNQIYIAKDLKHNEREIIIKQITAQNQKCLEREKYITKDLINLYNTKKYNKNIIEYYDMFEENDSTFIVMEKCESDLSQFYKKQFSTIEKNTQFQYQVLEIFQQIILGYKFLIEQFGSDFLHRDIKPQNILVVGQQFKICDFGLSRNSNEHPTKYIGTHYFQAPELCGDNTYDNKCDIYSLGILLLWLLTDQYSKNAISKLNINLQDLLQQMLQENPERRISWRDLIHHNVVILQPRNFLNITGLDNNITMNFQDLSQIIKQAELDSTQSSFCQKANQSFIQQKNQVSLSYLNNLISDSFKHVKETDKELSRILFALWIKVYDKEIQLERDESKRNELYKLKITLQHQQLIRIVNQVDYRIEFLSIQELRKELNNYIEHFKNDMDLINRLKEFFN